MLAARKPRHHINRAASPAGTVASAVVVGAQAQIRRRRVGWWVARANVRSATRQCERSLEAALAEENAGVRNAKLPELKA